MSTSEHGANEQTLVVPDRKRLKAVESLCLKSDPYSNFKSTDTEFATAMLEIIRWHSDKSDIYRRFLATKKFSLTDFEKNRDLRTVPYIPANFFKEFEVKSCSDEEVFLHLTSSGTMGQKSQMFFDRWSIQSAQRMVDLIIQHYNWVSDKAANYLLYSYQPLESFKLGTSYTDNFLCKYAPINDLFYALRMASPTKHEFDAFGCIEALQRFEKQNLPLRIFGFPAFLYFTLQRMADLKVTPLKFDKTSWVFLGGGWKGHANQSVSKQKLYDMIESMLGIPQAQIRDGFGSVEHCIPYVECGHHRFHVPVWSRVLIRDVRTMEVLGHEKPGFLQLVSPYITSVPAHSVLMGDYATLHEECECHLDTPWFEVHGRAGISKNKSCAMAASELLARVS